MDMKSVVLSVGKILATAIATLALLILWTTDEAEYDDEFSITIEYDCRVVLKDPGDFSEQVVTECRNRFSKTKLPAVLTV